ncbi:MFS transporter [Fodinicola acaciae]|uniref:MFS transporter n=1 Tax=Fodinicola acaciae TaxID=2681555 RepID=UPI0013D76990|nr:MFS transporter [Fodinicola acaciae]
MAPVRRLWLAVLCGYLALGATLQALPAYVPARFGGGALAAGTAVGIAFLATACCRPFAGRLADAGRSRPVVMLGGALTALGGIGHLVAPDLGALLLARLVMGAGEAALFSGALPWVLAGTKAEHRGRVAGWFGLSMWGGLSGGPVIATVVGDAYAVWWVVVALSGLSMALVATTRQAGGGALEPIRHWRELVPAGVAMPGLAIGLAAYAYGTVAALLVLHLRVDRIGADGFGLTVFAVFFLLTRFAGSPSVDRYGGRLVAVWSVSLEVVALLVVAFAGSASVAMAGTALAGVGLGLIYPACAALTLDRVRGMRPGVAMGVMTSFWDLGVMAAGPAGGAVAAGFGYPAAFCIAAGMGLLCVTVAFVFLRTKNHLVCSVDAS